jgi:hypothetical protein
MAIQKLRVCFQGVCGAALRAVFQKFASCGWIPFGFHLPSAQIQIICRGAPTYEKNRDECRYDGSHGIRPFPTVLG